MGQETQKGQMDWIPDNRPEDTRSMEFLVIMLLFMVGALCFIGLAVYLWR